MSIVIGGVSVWVSDRVDWKDQVLRVYASSGNIIVSATTPFDEPTQRLCRACKDEDGFLSSRLGRQLTAQALSKYCMKFTEAAGATDLAVLQARIQEIRDEPLDVTVEDGPAVLG